MPSSRRSPAIEALVAAFIDQLTDAVEGQIDTRARELADDWLRSFLGRSGSRVAAGSRPGAGLLRPAAATSRDLSGRKPLTVPLALVPPPTAVPGRTTARVSATVAVREKPPAAPADPEQERRDAELARLRSILKPAHELAPAPAADPAPLHAPAAAAVARAESPPDTLKQLEDQIRDQVQALADVSPSRCTARIASWAGRVRAIESDAPAGRTRPAAQLLLEKLRGLARAMDAGPIEALHPSWRTSNWSSYIAINEATADAPDREPASRPAEPAPEDAAGGSESYTDVW
jgi:hypothetical protein